MGSSDSLYQELSDAAEELRQSDLPMLAEAVLVARARLSSASDTALYPAIPDQGCALYPYEDER